MAGTTRQLGRLLRPALLIRRQAIYAGILGSSRLWQGVAFFIFGRRALKRLFGRNAELLMSAALRPGGRVLVETAKPTTRRQRRRLVRAGTPPPTLKQRRRAAQAEADALALAARR